MIDGKEVQLPVPYKAKNKDIQNYEEKPIRIEDIQALREIAKAHNGERISISDFTQEDIQRAQKWAYKFYQELGTKSPFFRAWFGDWRAYDTANTNIVSVPTIDISEAILEYGDYSIPDTGWTVHAGSTLNNDTRHHSGGNRINVKSLSAIKEILRNAVLFDTVVSYPDTNTKSVNTEFLHKMYSIVEYGGKKYLACTTVEEFFDESKKGDALRAYNLKSIKIEPAGGSEGINPTTSNVGRGSTISISDLYSFVKRYDKDFHPGKPVHSALLNENGTPKILYHQTKADIDVFNTDNPVAGKNDSETPNGIFFKENDHDIGLFGKKQMAVYLDMKKPLRFADRKVANKWYCKNIDGYERLQNEMMDKLKPFQKRLDDLEDKMFADEIDTSTYDKLDKEWNDELERMRSVEDRYRGELRELLDDYFIRNNSGYDGIILDYDGHRYVNGQREDVKSYIVFNNRQIKSATDNIGTFDKTERIRYSIKDIQNYDEKMYNKRGWAVVHDYVSKYGMRVFGEKLRNIDTELNIDGYYIVSVPSSDKSGDNTIIITDGNYEDPSIERVYRINFDNESAIEDVREEIIDAEQNNSGQSGRFIAELKTRGLVKRYESDSAQNYLEAIRRWKQEESARDSRRTNQNRTRKQNGRGVSRSNQTVSDGRRRHSLKSKEKITELQKLSIEYKRAKAEGNTEEIKKRYRLNQKRGRFLSLFFDAY